MGPLELCPKIRTYRKFRHGKSMALSTKLVVVVDGRACWRHLYDDRRVVAVYYKSVNCNPLTPLLRFVVDLSYNLFLQLARLWLTQRVARSLCASRASCSVSYITQCRWYRYCVQKRLQTRKTTPKWTPKRPRTQPAVRSKRQHRWPQLHEQSWLQMPLRVCITSYTFTFSNTKSYPTVNVWTYLAYKHASFSIWFYVTNICMVLSTLTTVILYVFASHLEL